MSNPRSFTIVALAILVGVGVVATGGSVVAGDSDHASAGIGIEALEGEIDPDDVLLAIDIDGEDAVWTIEYRTRLETDDERDAFEDLQTDIEADPDAFTATFHDRMNATADDATAATGREMAITEMTIAAERTELPQEYGVVTYTFRWSNFATVDEDGRLAVGDAIDGLFLDDASALRIGWTGEWTLADATPAPAETRDEAVVWQGPTSFAGGEPRVYLDPIDSGTDDEVPDEGVSDDGVSDTGDTDRIGTDGDVSTLVFAGALLVSVLIVFGARRRFSGADSSEEAATIGPDATAEDSESTPDETDASPTDETGGSDDVPGDDADSGTDADSGDDADSGESDAGPFATGVDPELLSNEEKVLRLIEANGGRMKQKRVAEKLDWTAAKTSQVTKRLREEGDLEGFRLGRENVLALPEEDPR